MSGVFGFRWVLLFVAAANSGCGTGPTKPVVDTSAVVGGLAQQRWDALVAGDIDKAYTYLSPGTRQARSLGTYRATVRGGLWKQAKVNRVDCSEADCEVRVQVEYLFKGSLISTPLIERWVRGDDGKWWAVLN